MDNSFENIEDLILKALSDEITESEAKILNERIDNDVEIRELYIRLAKSWSLSSLHLKPSKFNVLSAWEETLPKIKKAQRKEGAYDLKVNRFLKHAAIWIVIFGLGVVTSFLVYQKSPTLFTKDSSSPVETIVPLGSKSFVQLPDGSKIWLNAGSKLSYNQDFNLKSRRVELIGEGYFDVTANPEKPFVVHAGNIDVKAFGTTFNVKAYPDEKVVETTLVEGEVTVEGITEQDEKFVRILKPGQKLTYTHDELIDEIEATDNDAKNESKIAEVNKKQVSQKSTPVSLETNIETEIYTSWKDDNWIIKGEHLDELIIMLERRFNVDMKLENQTLKNYKFTGTIRRETLEQVMEILKYSAPIKYNIDKSNVSIQFDKKRAKNYMYTIDAN